MLSPSSTFTGNSCTPGNNYPGASQTCNSMGPGSSSNLPGTSGCQKPGIHHPFL